MVFAIGMAVLPGCGIRSATPVPDSVESKMVGKWKAANVEPKTGLDKALIDSVTYEIMLNYATNTYDSNPEPCLFGTFTEVLNLKRGTQLAVDVIEATVEGASADNTTTVKIPRLKVSGLTASATESSENFLKTLPHNGMSWTLRLDSSDPSLLYVTSKSKTGVTGVENMQFKRVK